MLDVAYLLEVAPERLAVEPRVGVAPVVVGERRSFVHAPGQQSVSERSVDEHADIVRIGVRQYVGLDVPTKQAVRRLERFHRPRRELCHLRDVEVRDSDMSDLALLDKFFSVPAVSARATFGSGQCTCYRSM